GRRTALSMMRTRSMPLRRAQRSPGRRPDRSGERSQVLLRSETPISQEEVRAKVSYLVADRHPPGRARRARDDRGAGSPDPDADLGVARARARRARVPEGRALPAHGLVQATRRPQQARLAVG